jgi:LuxR family maltose regulon positive regulatory protein
LIDDIGVPFVLVVDDADLLRDRVTTDVLATLAVRLPREAQLVLAGREMPALPLARLRAGGRLIEVGASELAMSDDEAHRLLGDAGLDVSPHVARELNARAEGWAAALYLAALALRERPDPSTSVASFGGDEWRISDYVQEEILNDLPDPQVRFLSRAAVLDRLEPSLCGAVLGDSGSAAMLLRLAHRNHLLIPLTPSGSIFRVHPLFREALLAELGRSEPELVPELHRRAAQWLEQNGRPGDAIDHAHSAGEREVAARLVCELAQSWTISGQMRTVRRWLSQFDDAAVEAYPPLAAFTALILTFAGDPAALGWLRRAEAATFDGPMPGGAASLDSLTWCVRALLAPNGIDEMLRDATRFLDAEPPSSPWHTGALTIRAIALMLLGRVTEARAGLEEAIDSAHPAQSIAISACHAELAIIAADAGDWARAVRHVESSRACAVGAGIDDDGTQILTFAVLAQLSMHQGDAQRAREALAHAHRLRAESTLTLPWLGVQARIAMARTHLALADPAGAWTVVRDAREIQRRRPYLGVLSEQLERMEAQLHATRANPIAGTTSLSTAELRVLAFLPTHLTFREIAQRLYVSPHTVKSQAISIYRKLGATGRSEALHRAEECGLLNA